MSHRSAEIAEVSFETDRLVIRSPRLGDAAHLNAAVRGSLDSLRPWMEWAQYEPPLDETVRRVRGNVEDLSKGTDFTFYAFSRDTGVLTVVIGLHPQSDAVPSFMIGYWCRTAEQGQGFTTEAVRAVIGWAFTTLGANRVELRCDPANAASRRVAEKAGFTFEGELRNESVRPDGTRRNTLVFSRIPEDLSEGE